MTILQEVIDYVLKFIGTLNLSYPESFVGKYFNIILGILAVIFGGSLVLFGQKQKQYLYALTGLIFGAIIGIYLKTAFGTASQFTPIIYVIVCGLLGMLAVIWYERIAGVLLGGITTVFLACVLSEIIANKIPSNYMNFVTIFLFGGVLGALFPEIFFIFDVALIGATFVTYGVSQIIAQGVNIPLSHDKVVLIHFFVFVPTLVFGIIYLTKTMKDGKPSEKGDKSEKPHPDKAKGKA